MLLSLLCYWRDFTVLRSDGRRYPKSQRREVCVREVQWLYDLDASWLGRDHKGLRVSSVGHVSPTCIIKCCPRPPFYFETPRRDPVLIKFDYIFISVCLSTSTSVYTFSPSSSFSSSPSSSSSTLKDHFVFIVNCLFVCRWRFMGSYDDPASLSKRGKENRQRNGRHLTSFILIRRKLGVCLHELFLLQSFLWFRYTVSPKDCLSPFSIFYKIVQAVPQEKL